MDNPINKEGIWDVVSDTKGNKKTVNSIFEAAKELMTREEWIKFLLISELNMYIVNICHFITDMSYLMHYFLYSDVVKNSKESVTYKQGLVSMSINLRKLLNTLQAKATELLVDIGVTQSKSFASFKKLVDRNVLQIMSDSCNILIKMSEQETKELATQVHNCLIGMFNINNFLKKIPSQVEKQFTIEQLDVLAKVLIDDLMKNWYIQLNMLNRLTFMMLVENKLIVTNYRRATGREEEDITNGTGFKNFVNWLRISVIGVHTQLPQ